MQKSVLAILDYARETFAVVESAVSVLKGKAKVAVGARISADVAAGKTTQKDVVAAFGKADIRGFTAGDVSSACRVATSTFVDTLTDKHYANISFQLLATLARKEYAADVASVVLDFIASRNAATDPQTIRVSTAGGRESSANILLGIIDSKVKAEKPVTAATLGRAFTAAVNKAKVAKPEPKPEPEAETTDAPTLEVTKSEDTATPSNNGPSKAYTAEDDANKARVAAASAMRDLIQRITGQAVPSDVYAVPAWCDEVATQWETLQKKGDPRTHIVPVHVAGRKVTGPTNNATTTVEK